MSTIICQNIYFVTSIRIKKNWNYFYFPHWIVFIPMIIQWLCDVKTFTLTLVDFYKSTTLFYTTGIYLMFDKYTHVFIVSQRVNIFITIFNRIIISLLKHFIRNYIFCYFLVSLNNYASYLRMLIEENEKQLTV